MKSKIWRESKDIFWFFCSSLSSYQNYDKSQLSFMCSPTEGYIPTAKSCPHLYQQKPFKHVEFTQVLMKTSRKTSREIQKVQYTPCFYPPTNSNITFLSPHIEQSKQKTPPTNKKQWPYPLFYPKALHNCKLSPLLLLYIWENQDKVVAQRSHEVSRSLMTLPPELSWTYILEIRFQTYDWVTLA